MLLRAISPSDPISAIAVSQFEQFAPVTRDIQFYTKPGAADLLKDKRTGATTSLFRSINEDLSPTKPTNTYTTVAKKIVSFEATVDVVLEDRNEDVNTELAEQSRLEAIDAAYLFQEAFFEGDDDVNAESFNGIRELVNASYLKDTADFDSTLTNGLVLALGNSDANVTLQQKAIEIIQQFFATIRGGASHAYMPESLKIRLLTIAKNLGYYRQSKDELGNTIEFINDVAIRGAGYKKDGTMLLPFSETLGESNVCTSIFAVRWGERSDLTSLTSVGLKGRYTGQVGNQYVNNFNLDMAFALANVTALSQLKGFRLV